MRITKDRKKAILSGITDRMVLRDDGSVLVDDLKTERYPKNNPIERYCYILAAQAKHPEADRFTFGLHYLRTGNYLRWQYQVSKGKEGWKIVETHPDGTATTHGPFRINPFMVYLKSEIAKIEKMEETPNPGPHCESWYGEPCQFLGSECPLAQTVSEEVDDLLPVDPQGLNPSGLLRAIAGTENLPITKEDASWAYSGLIQLQGFCRAVETRLKEWSKKNGPIEVGNDKYGWFTTTDENEVDKVFALSEMLRSMEFEDVAKAISLSKTSIGSISKRKYGQLRDTLLSLAVTTRDSKPKFGAI